jgi:hypothetical protein
LFVSFRVTSWIALTHGEKSRNKLRPIKFYPNFVDRFSRAKLLMNRED